MHLRGMFCCLTVSCLTFILLFAAENPAGGKRDRAQGWRHAKLSGHANEDRIEDRLRHAPDFQARFLKRVGRPGRKIVEVSGGGLGEAHVPSVFASVAVTTPKADMYVRLDNGEVLTFSIKKSLSGQVYLVTVDKFIEAYESHFESIPAIVKAGIRLYWGCTTNITAVIERHGTCRAYETRKHRVVASTLRTYDPQTCEALLRWFTDKAGNLAELCFARGAAKDQHDWAQYVWYKNEVGESAVDAIYRVSDICAATQATARRTCFGKANGGSTIQLPFGFVQWHSPQKVIPGDMQFHHRHAAVDEIVRETGREAF